MFWGKGQEASHIYNRHLCALSEIFASHTHICACACVAYSRPKRSIFRSSLPANGTGVLVSPPSLSCPAVHSAERDICSVRECPNYSWSFNHSGFSLCGICGASHKSVTATLFISDLYFQITLKNTHTHIYIGHSNIWTIILTTFYCCFIVACSLFLFNLMNECKK